MRFTALSSVRKLVLASAMAGLLAIAATPSSAQDDPPAQAGRLSYLSGAVSIQPDGANDWAQAYPNAPLGPGDRIYTDSDGRAEIQIGQTYVRTGRNTDVTVDVLNDHGLAFGLAQGTLHIHAGGLWPGQSLHVHTPNGSVTLSERGDFRVEVFPDQNAAVFTANTDGLTVNGADGFSQVVGRGLALELAGTNPVAPQWVNYNQPDDLDRWSEARDRQVYGSASFRYVSREIPGADDLDANGDWQPGSDYGAVWYPRNVPAGWAPYHNGHWVNHAPWGWIWVEDESWGYAPFHYGRWVVINGRWGWIPGPPAARPVWSPALVVFAGGVQVGGAGLSVWFPLGPGEAYHPWYHASPSYVNQVNITNITETRIVHVQTTYVNVTNVTNVTYVNRTVGASAMRQEDFASGRSAKDVAVKVDPHQLEHVQVLEKPEPKPIAQTVALHPPARPVPVKTERPVLINEQGKLVSAKPGARPVEVPVKSVPPQAIKPLPGHPVVVDQKALPPLKGAPAPAAAPVKPEMKPTPTPVPVRPDAKAAPKAPVAPEPKPMEKPAPKVMTPEAKPVEKAPPPATAVPKPGTPVKPAPKKDEKKKPEEPK